MTGPGTHPESHLIGQDIHSFLRQSPALTLADEINSRYYRSENCRDFQPRLAFGFGVGGKNRSASELWLSAYVGNYIGNCLSFLNDFLERVEIEPEVKGINTKLSVKWARVAATFGGLVVFQVLCGLAGWIYCRGNLEIVDDVSAFVSMFTGFPLLSGEERRQEGLVYQGKFVRDGEGFRWIFVMGAGKTSKVE